MPTPLPARSRFWRRHAPSPESLRNLAATVTECGLALLCVAVTTLAVARFVVS